MKEKILIIEDEEDLVKGLQLNLSDEGYVVDYALNGKEGLQKALEQSPDLILLDLMMPEMDGLEVCRRLREQKNRVPILMLTAKGEEVNKIEMDELVEKFMEITSLNLTVDAQTNPEAIVHHARLCALSCIEREKKAVSEALLMVSDYLPAKEFMRLTIQCQLNYIKKQTAIKISGYDL